MSEGKDSAASEDRILGSEALKAFAHPLRMSLYQSAGEDRWLSEPGLVAVAAERQVEALPVVFFYHTNQRQACGVPADCIDHVKEAVQQGSQRADFSPIAPPPRPSGPAVYPPLPPVSPN